MEQKEILERLQRQIEKQKDFRVKTDLVAVKRAIKLQRNFLRFPEKDKKIISTVVGILMDEEVLHEFFLSMHTGEIYF